MHGSDLENMMINLCLKCYYNVIGQQTRHIETTGSGSGEWFQSTGIKIIGSNQLLFQVKGSRDAILGLATEDR